MLRCADMRGLAGWLALLLCALHGDMAGAATIERRPIPEMGCDILVSGDIVAGDAAALRAALSASDADLARAIGYPVLDAPMVGMRGPDRRRVCFDSRGGSFLEGLAIAELLIEYRKGAAVGDGMICESACALAFMGGSMAVSQIEGSDDTDRVLHPRGLLGVHAPSLVVPDGQYDEATVTRAYGVALAALQALSQTRNTVFRGYVPGTDQATSFRYRFPESLLLEMLATPPDRMRHVTTVGEASRWDIRIAPVALPALTAPHARFAAACDNVAGYLGEITPFSFETPPFLDALRGRGVAFAVQAAGDLAPGDGFGQPAAWRGTPGADGLRVIADMGEYWHECDVEIFGGGAPSLDPFAPVGAVIFGARRSVYPFQFFDPAAPITALAPQPGAAADTAGVIASLSAELAGARAASALSCWLTAPAARIVNVTQYVNLRRAPDFAAPVIREVPLGEQVRAVSPDNVTVIGDQRTYDACVRACRAFAQNPGDRPAADRAQQCIADNLLWVEITDARGNRGWVSRRFLAEGP